MCGAVDPRVPCFPLACLVFNEVGVQCCLYLGNLPLAVIYLIN